MTLSARGAIPSPGRRTMASGGRPVPQRTDLLAMLPMHAIIPRLSGTPGGLARAAPRLGEHSREVLRSAGLSEAAIEELIARKVIAS